MCSSKSKLANFNWKNTFQWGTTTAYYVSVYSLHSSRCKAQNYDLVFPKDILSHLPKNVPKKIPWKITTSSTNLTKTKGASTKSPCSKETLSSFVVLCNAHQSIPAAKTCEMSSHRVNLQWYNQDYENYSNNAYIKLTKTIFPVKNESIFHTTKQDPN